MLGSYPEIRQIILATHNLLRWVIVILAVYALVRLILGWVQNRNWVQPDQKAVTFFTIALDIQLLVGLLLYFVFSDLIKAAFSDFGAAMSNQVLRFFTVEHSLLMVFAVIIAHVANAAGKKDLTDAKKFQRVTLLLGLAVVLIIAGVPWASRPLLPVF